MVFERILKEHLYPWVNSFVDLGSSLLRWRKIWTEDFDANGVVTISRTPVATTDAVNKAYADALTPNPTIEEVDGAPSYTDSDTIRFDQADGFVITQPGAGIARVDLAAIPNSVLANSTITIQGTAVALGGTRVPLVLASADHVNEGSTTTVLHGNAAGNPSWGAVGLTTDVAGTLPAERGGTGAANTTGYTQAGLPAAGTAGRLARVTDNVRGLWMDQGSQWFGLSGETVNVKEFGAKGDDLTDDTVAIQAAHDALGANGGTVFFPPGIYRVTTINITKPARFLGTARLASRISALSATADVLNITQQGAGAQELFFTSVPVRTGGSFIRYVTGATLGLVQNCYLEKYFIGIRLSASINRVDNCDIRDGATTANGAGILVDDGSDHWINHVTMDAPNASQPTAGIQITSSGNINITDSDIIHHGTDLLVNPGAGQTVASLTVTGSYFDTCSARAILINPTGTGQVVRTRFVNSWSATATSVGILLLPGGTGALDGIEFIGHHSVNNGGHGLQAEPGVTNLKIIGGVFAGNTGQGILIAAGVNEFSIIGARSGAAIGFAANTQFGIRVDAGVSTNYMIMSNDLRGNTVGSLFDGGTGTTKYIFGNLGVNPGGTATITVGASPFTYTAGGTPETIYINTGTVSLITVEGVSVFQQTNQTVRLGPMKSVIVTYTVAPGMTKTID